MVGAPKPPHPLVDELQGAEVRHCDDGRSLARDVGHSRARRGARRRRPATPVRKAGVEIPSLDATLLDDAWIWSSRGPPLSSRRTFPTSDVVQRSDLLGLPAIPALCQRPMMR